jgi:hypothetical protein
LLPVKDGNITFAKSPLFALLEGRQDILSGEFIHCIRAKIQNNGNLLAVQQLLFSFQHKTPSEESLELPYGKRIFLASSKDCVKVTKADATREFDFLTVHGPPNGASLSPVGELVQNAHDCGL